MEITIELRAPIVYGPAEHPERIERLTLREPRAAEAEAAFREVRNYTMHLIMIAAVSGVPINLIRRMGAKDVATAWGFIDEFFAAPVAPEGETTATLTIDPPLIYGTAEEPQSLSELRLREPTGAEAETALAEPHGYLQQLMLVAAVSGVPLDVVRKARVSDVARAWAFISPFFVPTRVGVDS